MADNPVFIDPNAYQVGVPRAAQPADLSPIGNSVSRIGESVARLGEILYKQDQESRILKTRLSLDQGFQTLQQSLAQETDIQKLNTDFQAGAEKLRTDAMANAIDDKTSQEIGLDFAKQNIATQGMVFSTAMKLKAEQGLSLITQSVTAINKRALTSSNINLPDEKNEILKLAQQGITMGTFNVATAENWKIEHLQELDQTRALYEEQKNSATALALLSEIGKDGNYTNFTDLDPLKRVTIMGVAEQHIKRDGLNISGTVEQGVKGVLSGALKPEAAIARITGVGANPADIVKATAVIKAAGEAKSLMEQYVVGNKQTKQDIVEKFNKLEFAEGNEAYVHIAPAFHEMITATERILREDAPVYADTYFKIKDKPLGDGGLYTTEQILNNRSYSYKVMGLDPGTPLLSKSESDTVIKTLKDTANVDGLKDYVHNTIARYGKYSGQIVKQLQKDGVPPEFIVMAGPEISADANSQLAITMNTIERDLLDKYPKGAGGEVPSLVEEARTEFNDGIGSTIGSGDPAERAAYWDTYRKLSLHMGSAEEAYKLLWGKVQVFKVDGDGNGVRIPFGFSSSETHNMMLAAGELLKHSEMLKPNFYTSDKKVIDQNLKEHSTWRTDTSNDGHDVGFVLIDKRSQRPIQDTSGKLIRYSWYRLNNSFKKTITSDGEGFIAKLEPIPVDETP